MVDGSQSDLVTLIRPGGDEEQRSAAWCKEHGFIEVNPGIWTGFWHEEHPSYKSPAEIPDLLRRNKAETCTSVGSSAQDEIIDLDENNGEEPPVPRGLNTGTTMFLHNEGDNVSLTSALEALRQARGILECAQNVNESWQHPRELLDATAAALDEAALALRSIEETESAGRDVKEEDTIQQINNLSSEVKGGRAGLLAAQAAAKSGPSAELLDTEEDATSLIVYATQTGTARRFARRLKRRLGAKMMNMADVTPADVACRKRVYFIVSTFGLGRPPCPAETFFASMQFLQARAAELAAKDRENDPEKPPRKLPFSKTEVAVAALGNSGFEEFAAFGTALQAELKALGAKEVMPLAKLDANKDQMAEFQAWLDQILELEGIPKEEDAKKKKGGVEQSACCTIM